jgi:excisionase family DNA binding protein
MGGKMTILTSREAAEFLRVSPRHLRELCKYSDIPHRQQGRGRITFSKEKLTDWWLRDHKPLALEIKLKKISLIRRG